MLCVEAMKHENYGHLLKAMRHKHVMRHKQVVEAEIGPCSGGYETQAYVVCVCVCMCVCAWPRES